eukprot:Phypoly_transcript_13172.p1 GENE.Phypoly_transcript_13172~~Phypoly_transcript_13172.p1  ORF type:complete len:207 (+),score=21.57 Phypoly_transcript_13172:425-1045(+)
MAEKARDGNISMVNTFLKYGLVEKKKTREGEAPCALYRSINALCTAVANNRTDIVKLLIKQGANIDKAMELNIAQNLKDALQDGNEVASKWDCLSAFHYAIINRYTDMVWILALEGTNTNIPYKEKGQEEKSVWELCENDASMREALQLYWSPKNHFRFPKSVRNVIVSVLLIAKRQRWPLDTELMYKIFQYTVQPMVGQQKLGEN